MIGYSRPLDKEIFRPGPTIFSRHHYRTLNKCGERGSDATLWCGKQKIELNHKMLWFLWWIE